MGVLLLGLLAVFPLAAQFSGRVTGSVVDSSGAAVPAAEVELYLAGGTRPLLTTKTSTDGWYNFMAVRPAYYDLTIEAAGFVKTTLRGVSVDPARETSVPQARLQLPTVTQTVDVSVEVQGVDTASAAGANQLGCPWVRQRGRRFRRPA